MASSTSVWSVEEISIPVPYGFIAAKAWGDKSGHPVLALHGWQDNSGSFDKLIPLLTPSLYVVAVDAIGNGLSSHKPHGTYYNFSDEFLDLRRIVTYFGWEKHGIIAHSLGGAVGLLYASMFPESVTNMVLLDMLKPISVNENIPKVARAAIETLLKLDSKINSNIPVYTLDEAKKRLMEATYDELSPESAAILLKRGSRKSDCGKGLIFTRDIRIRYSDYAFKYSNELLESYLKNLRCNLLIFRCTNSTYKTRDAETVAKFFKIYEENCNSFKLVKLHENHFVHLNQPEIVAPIINVFFNEHLNNSESKL